MVDSAVLAPRTANFAKFRALKTLFFSLMIFCIILNPIEFSKESKGSRVWIKKSKQLIPNEKKKIDKSGT